MLETLKEAVCAANLELVKRGVVIYTWGNVSGIDREKGLMVIKPSGVPYESMTAGDMVAVDAETGETVEGKWKPSSDTETHLALYRAFPEIGGVAHTHSVNAAAFAQAGLDIPALGTTHTEEETKNAYEKNTGAVIIETVRCRGYEPLAVPGALVRNHGPFAWGKNAADAVYHAVVMETAAEMALKTKLLNPSASLPAYILDEHYQRKHGPNATYGQGK